MVHVPLLQCGENGSSQSEVIFAQSIFLLALVLLVLNLHWQHEAFAYLLLMILLFIIHRCYHV